MANAQAQYTIAIMETQLETAEEEFHRVVDAATRIVERVLAGQKEQLRVRVLQFNGPNLTPAAGGGYSPLDFLRVGIVEKLERDPSFLIAVTDVDLAPTAQSYLLGLPSELTNVAVISTIRLDPAFWGNAPNEELFVHRLAALLIHNIGHLLTLPHSKDPQNYMHDFQLVEGLDKMEYLTEEQLAHMVRMLPRESRDKTRRSSGFADSLRFTVDRVLANWRPIWRTVTRANPLRLAIHFPTMITAGLSVSVVLFFSSETWDLASTIALWEIGSFSLIAVAVATALMYRAYGLPTAAVRNRLMAESIIVSRTATIVTLILTIIVLYVLFFFVATLGIVLIFPDRLMETWPTVGPAVRTIDHVRLGMFMAAMSVLAGSLGGRAENKAVIRRILFVDEET